MWFTVARPHPPEVVSPAQTSEALSLVHGLWYRAASRELVEAREPLGVAPRQKRPATRVQIPDGILHIAH
jgi:hypothetical protein